MRDKTFVFVCSIIGIIVIVFAAVYWRTGTLNIISLVSRDRQQEVEGAAKNYRAETTWDGSGETGEEVYLFPFDKGYGQYVTNIEYYKDLGNATDKAERLMRTTASGFMNALFGRGYRSLLEDRAGYVNSLQPYLSDYFQHKDAQEFANEIADWIINSQYQAEVKFATDHSLIWTDTYSYLRAEITLTVYQGTNHDSFIDEGFCPAKSGKYIIDFQMVFDKELDKYCVNGIEYIAEIE